MPFPRPTLEDLRTRITSDLVTALSLSSPVLRHSVVGTLADIEAAATHLLHGHLEFLGRQAFPDTSDDEFLQRQASVFGLFPQAATYATGNIVVTGTNGVTVPSGAVLQRSDGVDYATTSAQTIASGTATVPVRAQSAGVIGNADAATALAFISPLAGVNASAAVESGGLFGGTDASVDALRTSVIDRMRQAPQGGSAADYVRWAKENAGVTRAWVSENGMGAGTVVLRFVRDGDGAGALIIPSGGAVAAMQSYIDARRPVGAAVTVVAPVAVVTNFTVFVSPDTPATRAATIAELTDLLVRTSAPGATLLYSQILAAIGVAEGVTNFGVGSPSGDTTRTAGQISVMGTVTFL